MSGKTIAIDLNAVGIEKRECPKLTKGCDLTEGSIHLSLPAQEYFLHGRSPQIFVGVGDSRCMHPCNPTIYEANVAGELSPWSSHISIEYLDAAHQKVTECEVPPWERSVLFEEA